jgi:transposase
MGFTLCRALLAEGFSCIVIAPSLVPKSPGDHVKTDKRDAEKLARFYRSGDLTEVYLPDTVTESMKDLERARFDAKNAQTAARQQLTHFLLRHGKRYEGVNSPLKNSRTCLLGGIGTLSSLGSPQICRILSVRPPRNRTNCAQKSCVGSSSTGC